MLTYSYLRFKWVALLADIWDYTFDQWSEEQADIYYDLLISNFEKIAENPDLGRNYSGITENLFGFRAGRHVIFYRRITQDEIEVARILHERMDLESRILD